jgi:hypothetical protein
MNSSSVWDITPCSLLKVNWRFRRKCHLHLKSKRVIQARNCEQAFLAACFTLVSCVAYSSTLKMEATVSFQWIWHYILEDRNSYFCEVCITFFLAHFINDKMVRAASETEITPPPHTHTHTQKFWDKNEVVWFSEGNTEKDKWYWMEMDKKRKVTGIQNNKCKWLHKATNYCTRWFQGWKW